MAVEAWNFETLSWLLEMEQPNDRAATGKRYGLFPNTLVSWIKTLAFVRNISAHNARLWNAGIISRWSASRSRHRSSCILMAIWSGARV